MVAGGVVALMAMFAWQPFGNAKKEPKDGSFFVAKIGILKKIQKERRHNLMTNSIGHGNEVPAPPIRRRIYKTKPNMSKAEKQQFYSQKSKKMGQK